MEKIIYIPVDNKKVKLTYKPDPNYEWAILVDCDEAWLHQGFLLDDLWGLLENIPLLVQKRKASRENFIKVRVTWEEKEKLAKLSCEKWFSSISAYIRNITLASN